MRQMHPQLNPLASSWRSFFRLTASVLVLVPVTLHAAGSAPTRTVLTSSAVNAGSAASSTELKAAVRTTAGTAVDAGTVDFLLGDGQSLGSAIVQADGTATLDVLKLPAGTTTAVDGAGALPVTAVYHAPSENAAFADSASVATPVASPQATTATPDFTVTGNPTTVTTAQGSYAVTSVTVSSVGSYTGALQFSCSGLPAQVTCAFNPTQQTLTAGGSFASTLELQTQGPSGTASSSLLPVDTGVGLALVLPGALMLLGFSGRQRKAFRGGQIVGLALLLAGSGVGLSGCSQRYGYLHHPPPVAGGTPIGTFPITVAVDGNQGSTVIEHDITISLVVH